MTGTVRALAVVILLLQTVWFGVGGQSWQEDGNALEAFLDAVLFNSNYTASQDPCAWLPAHVGCQSKRISTIDLSGFQLAGTIPGSTLSQLTELTVLNLAENNLTGRLPTDLSRLSKLQNLILSRNNLSGAYPDFLATLTQLRELNLSGNEYDGLVLDAVAKLPLLSKLDLSENRFVGNISTLFQALKNLEFVDLSRNSFEGSIPDGICDSQVLATLRLSSNGFTGPIPNSIQACRSLQSLDLSSNQLDGIIPENIHQMTALQELDLARNLIEGPIPASIFQHPALRVFNLSTNKLDGFPSIPDGAGQQLVEVNLESNRLNGTIPPSLLQLPNLVTLKLGNNSFSGPLPTSILPPPEARSLRELDLHKNQLTGALPGLETGLLKVDFSSNSFSGGLSSVPQGLQVLDMHKNRLDGGLLFLSRVVSLTYLDLSSNLFSGKFPSNFSHLVNVTRLALADNNFSSYSFPDLGLPDQLEELNLSMTNLMGMIPPAIGHLRLMKLLDLSVNNLTGVMPTEMRMLNNLEILDLSDNKLQGKIPPDMINLTSLSFLDLSNNNLSGKIPVGNQWLTFPNNSFLGNVGLCGTQVDIVCPEDNFRGKNSNDPDDGTSSSKKKGLIIGLVTGFAVLLIVALSLFIWCRVSNAVKPVLKDEITGMSVSGPMVSEKDPETWAKGIKDPHSIPLVMFEKPLLNLTFTDLLQATANFNKELQIADGGYGPVYKGILPDGTLLAIKVLVEVKFTDGRDAVARIEALASNKHPNLVALVGYCLVGIDSLLLYEYMVKGDLQRWLHELPEGTRNPEDWSGDTWEHMEGDEIATEFLSWPTRHKIALGTARALAFLHHGCSPCVVHRDVKSSNILLDESFDAHLVDGGLAGIAKPTTLVIGGTVGYVPPEYGQSWQATPRGDVYSFGVVLLELVTGRKPTGHYFHDSYGGNLVGWVRLVIKDKRGQKALDPKLASHGDVNQMQEVLRIGYLCTAESPAKRPTMQQVVGLLKDCQPGP